MSSCVWTAPGRSTMTTRPVSSAVTGGIGQRLGGVAGPAAERVGEHRVQVDAGQVADDDGGRRGGPHVSLRRSARTAAASIRSTVSSVPWRGRDMPRGRREQLLGQLPGGAPGRVGQLVRDLVETVAHQPLDLAVRRTRARAARRRAGRAPWPGGRREPRARRATPGWSACASRVAPQRSSSAANSSAVCLSVPSETARRAMIVATPSRPVGLGVQRRVQADLDGDDLLAGAVAAQHGQPVAQARRARARGRPRAWARPPGGCGWKSMVTAARSLARLLGSSSARPRGLGSASARCRASRRSPARRPARRGCRGAAGPRRPPGPPRR